MLQDLRLDDPALPRSLIKATMLVQGLA